MAHTATDTRVAAVCSPASTSSWLSTSTRREHRGVESRLDLANVRHPADLAGMLRGWSNVWRAVGESAPVEGTNVPCDLLVRAVIQSIDWLSTDLRELAATDARCAEDAEVDAADQTRAADGNGRLAFTEHDHLRRLLAAPAGGWGVAYVLLGSRLGGSVIGPRLSAALALDDGIGMRFLVSAGTSPVRDWERFKLRLDSASFTDDELTTAAEAARWTFHWVGAVIAASLASASRVPS